MDKWITPVSSFEYFGIFLSYVYVFAIIGIATFLQKKQVFSQEGSRKFIHILLSNWWILAMILFKSNIAAAVGPFTFVVINYLSYKRKWFSAMEREGGKADLGTVYYAISLLILALVTFSPFSNPSIGALGILIMGYGDGMAAVAGKRFGRRKYRISGCEKSFEGSVTMFIISFIITFILLSIFPVPGKFLFCVLIALFAALSEGITPHGFDNLTVPLGTSLFFWILVNVVPETLCIKF
jgi:phytol kinase